MIDEETWEIDFKETELKFYKNYIIGDPSFLVDEKYVDLTFLTIPPNIKTIWKYFQHPVTNFY